MTAGNNAGENTAEEPVTVTDNRRVDPETGEVRDGAGTQQAEAAADDAAAQPAGDQATPADAQVAELTEALQRERAQFANFRRRSAEEQLQAVDRGKQILVEKLLPILDDLDRARDHGDLDEGPLRAFADKLVDVLSGEKLAKFAEPGEEFDPELHEAIQNDGSGDTPVIGNVFRTGYRLGDKVIRHAMVTVTDPAPSDAAPEQ
ncbi:MULTISPECIES: nucleotide exchange factor GrpE [Gordonia]|uniref:Protein GrpE n=2 Tax=Gordonia TaxID=2053 RepID=L7LIV4_9ACTN|nr:MULTISPECIES: nucleotide exchange factor GrpE [Gordonia]AUH67861.1 nucleotide exchange factor GrpE [Gordonia sp. YC-JH1]KJR05811.1 molecular chaperone GrpE [Gordonia sihwensis]KXT58307.1 molecular chaperone GrpE [Gordonia sp. QH-12]WFN92439.1 nucleotide exchange factor GrpE [Gordonia sihwensis]GAC60676.1 GrpE protein [Gordonia sihwensis NBRC 108236]